MKKHLAKEVAESFDLVSSCDNSDDLPCSVRGVEFNNKYCDCHLTELGSASCKTELQLTHRRQTDW